MKRYFTVFALVICGFWVNARQIPQGPVYPIIPYPASLKPLAGHFLITEKTTLSTSGGFANEELYFSKLVKNFLGQGALGHGAGTSRIVLKRDPSISANEGYKLSITPHQITLSAKDAAGMFYAIQSLRQLMPADVETGKGEQIRIPCADIRDQPVMSWRGMMLDVSRHFFSVAYLKKYVDMMALYKLNKLHLHLTDDQGWRIEIKKYPRLTEESAWRTYNSNDTACMNRAAATGNTDFELDKEHLVQKNGQTLYGGYYTQEQMREFIRYAASRHVEVIPEIDMPGHMMAAVKIYPELTCDTLVGNIQHDFSNPICPCNDKVLAFAKDIFSEISEIFPSRYIHIGGDEVNTRNWARSAVVKAFMKQRGFTKMSQVQSYFNDYMQAFFKSKGKTLVGWDEIVEGGIDSSAVMMFWRSWAHNAPLEGAQNHNKIVMSPDGPLYFDGIPDAGTLPEVYHYEPLSDSLYHLNDEQKKQIIGVQGNLWTEMIPSEKRADYMIMPRMTALAEIGWTHRDQYEFYLQRLDEQYDRLDRLDVNYRLPDLSELVDNYAVVGATPFFVASPLPRFTVHYTTDGTLPNAGSPMLARPLMVNRAMVMKLALFTPGGRRGDVYTLHFNTQQYGQTQNAGSLKAGLRGELYKREFPLAAGITGSPDSVFTSAGVEVPKSVTAPAFGLKLKGYIQVPETGIYTFYLKTNDGGVLYIGDQKIIDNDGFHGDKTKGGQAGLQKGLHPFAVNFMEGGGGYVLDLKYSYQNSAPAPVPASWLKSDQ